MPHHRTPLPLGAPLPSTPLPSAKSSAKVIVTRGPPPNRTVFALSLCSFLPLPTPNQTSEETGTVSKSQEAHHPPSSAKSSFHVYRLGTTTNAQSHTFSRHNDRMPFFFCKLSCQCSLHDNAPLRRGGVLSYAQTLASFPAFSFSFFHFPSLTLMTLWVTRHKLPNFFETLRISKSTSLPAVSL